MVKMIIPTNPGNIEKVACSLSVIEKFNFTSMILSQTFASVSKEGKKKREINHVPTKYLPHLCQSIVVKEYAHDDGLKEEIGGLF